MADDNTCFFHAESTLACLAAAFRGGRPCFFPLKSTLMRHVHLLPVSAAARTGSKTRSERREDRSRAGRGTGRRPRPRQGRGGSGKEGGRTGNGNGNGEGVQKRKGRRRQEVTILLSVVAPQRRQPPALPPFRAVPSAHAGLTSLFGMGRGVAPPRRRRFLFPEPPQTGSRMPGERTSK